MTRATTRPLSKLASLWISTYFACALAMSLATPRHCVAQESENGREAPKQKSHRQVTRLSASAWKPANHRTHFQSAGFPVQGAFSDSPPNAGGSGGSAQGAVLPALPPSLPSPTGGSVDSSDLTPATLPPLPTERPFQVTPSASGMNAGLGSGLPPQLPSGSSRSGPLPGGTLPGEPTENTRGMSTPNAVADRLPGTTGLSGSTALPSTQGPQSMPRQGNLGNSPRGLGAAAPMPTMNRRGDGPSAANPAVSPANFNSNGVEFRTQQDSGLNRASPTSPLASPGSPRPQNQPRSIPASQVATGAPFVSRPRTGNYATRPYNPALFQHTLYERVQPTNSLAGYGRAQAGNSQLRSQNNTLPATTAGGPNAQLVSNQTQPSAIAQQPPPPGFYPTAYQQCAPAPGFPSAGINPAYVPPTITPNYAPNMYAAGNAGYRPLFTLGQENYNVSMGRGIIGQPTVYVSGQPVRNFLRYLSP